MSSHIFVKLKSLGTRWEGPLGRGRKTAILCENRMMILFGFNKK
ncbi:hypothetical protein [Leptospira interrogans]|uniref:Uncharacterized protein n=1 Tax=Leptospira interrogans serovar Hardjo str. Norma TaxID=1279460 RepID=A0A0M4P2P5_LEPIR|nr:hypothetical protein [Leptospira interrogans]ALE41692.1 hypothetical protein G436_4563 [Leptospira interrogans serovar Hardjo str. Norma]MDC2815119.1 hypothetical protein [Leptospira interrogans]